MDSSSILGFYWGSRNSSVDIGISMWILEIQYISWKANVKYSLILGFHWGSRNSSVDIGIPVLILKYRLYIDSRKPMWIMEFQSGCWVSSVDFKVPVWILVLRNGSWYSRVDFKFVAYIMEFPCGS